MSGARITVEFKGKGGKLSHAEVTDRRLARTLQRLHDLPGRELFEYRDGDGKRRRVRSEDVNAYLQDASGEDLTVKDFRTWGASALCMRALAEIGAPTSAAKADRVDRRGGSRGRGRARQHPRGLPCVVRPSRAAGVLRDGLLAAPGGPPAAGPGSLGIRTAALPAGALQELSPV